MLDDQPHLWKLLWDYDPNGLIVVDPDLYIQWVNPAFCRMFQVQADHVVGQSLEVIFDDVDDFKQVWQQNLVIRGKFREYAQYNLYINQVIFAIAEAGLVASILVDISHELARKRELDQLKQETIHKVNAVVDNQMKVVQEIAGLLGETTAATKVNLLKIIELLQRDSH
jgi:PAS domain S-box-containing protein